MSTEIDVDSYIDVNDSFLTKKGLCGLNNLGNTCFMNSIIQCLSNTMPLLKFFLNNKYQSELNKCSPDYKIVVEWNSLCRALWHKNAVVTPKNFHRSIQRRAMERDYDDFTGYGQNDSQEFLQFLLESFHNCFSKKVNMTVVGKQKNALDKIAIEALNGFKEYFKNDYSSIIDIFYGQYFSRLYTYKSEGVKISNTFDPFSCLSIEITPETHDLYACLNSFTSKENIENNSVKQQKTIAFWKLPKILIIFLKRFNNSSQKNNSLVKFPINNLDMSRYVLGYNKSKYVYDLYAVSNHSGGCHGGHYYAFCKNNDNNWYKYDDNVVYTLNESKVVDSSAYCLFYKMK